MKNAWFVVVAGPLLALLACAPDAVQTAGADSARGAHLLEPFKKDLKQALVAGMEKGPPHAISVCKTEAPAIAAALSVDGVKMGRTSHRLRNPANAAPDWVKPILASYLDEPGKIAPRVAALPGHRAGYVEPIVLQPLCVACHGETLASAVAAQIERDYPDDQATGFAVGDLRGVFWVEYPTGN